MYPTAVLAAFLCGCAANAQSSSAVTEAEPGCSFRSPTTCWGVSGRFPVVPPKPAAPPLDRAPRPPSTVLAGKADSTRGY